jgi:5-methylcytosine-specific restriction endonuclease McrA
LIIREAEYQKPPILSGEDNGNWRGGKSLCIDCGKELSQRHYTRCGSCARKGSLNPYHLKCLKENIKSHKELMKAIRNTFKYRQWRSDVYTRDGFACQMCGDKGRRLEAHHIKSMVAVVKEYRVSNVEEALGCDKLWDLNNGKTLCEKCHSTTDNYKGRNNSLLREMSKIKD